MKKKNWRIRGIKKDRLQLISYQGSDFMGEPVVYRTTVSDINPNTGRHWSNQQRDKLCSRFDAECAKGNISHYDTITVTEMCEKVMDAKIRPYSPANTVKGYESCLRRIKATCGEKRASSMTPKAIQDWVNYLSSEYVDVDARLRAEKSGKEIKTGLAPKTIKNNYSFLHMCYDTMIEWQALESNPCYKTKLPPAKTSEPDSFTLDEVRAFVDALENVPPEKYDYKVACLLALCCGLRQSEICGINEKEQLNLEAGTLVIDRAQHIRHGSLEMGETKTASSIDKVVLPDGLVSEIRKLQTYHKMRAIQMGPLWHTSVSLIKGAYGDPMYNNNLWEWLNDFLKSNGIRHIRFHDLRHTYVSMLRSFGADIVEISHEARHSQKTTTLNIYSHLFMDATEMKRKNAMKNSNTLFPSANSCPIHAQKKNQR